MSTAIKLTKTEESLFTLISLFVLIEQSLESIYGNEDILYSEFDKKNNSFHNLVTDTIHEALTYRILLKTCAFVDEWNNMFGVTTDEKDHERIRVVKRIAKPVIKQILEWKQLREFRNEAIAHNHRDKTGNNIYLNAKGYNFPDTDGELYLMVFCIKKAMDVVKFFFEEELVKIVKVAAKKIKVPKQKRLTALVIKQKIKELQEAIDNPLADIFMRRKILSAYAQALPLEEQINK